MHHCCLKSNDDQRFGSTECRCPSCHLIDPQAGRFPRLFLVAPSSSSMRHLKSPASYITIRRSLMLRVRTLEADHWTRGYSASSACRLDVAVPTRPQYHHYLGALARAGSLSSCNLPLFHYRVPAGVYAFAGSRTKMAPPLDGNRRNSF